MTMLHGFMIHARWAVVRKIEQKISIVEMRMLMILRLMRSDKKR